jgi:hypothetical protein
VRIAVLSSRPVALGFADLVIVKARARAGAEVPALARRPRPAPSPLDPTKAPCLRVAALPGAVFPDVQAALA